MDLSFIPQSFTFWAVLGIIMVYVNGLYLNRIFVKYKILEQTAFLPSFIFITLAATYPEIIRYPVSLISLFIMTWVLDNLLKIFDLELATQNLFFVSAAIALCTLFFAPAILFLVLVIIALPVLKRPTWWEMSIIPFGFFIIIYLAGFGFYLNDHLDVFINKFSDTFPLAKLNYPHSTSINIAPTVFIFILLAIGFFRYYLVRSFRMVRDIRYNRVFNTYFVIALLILFLTDTPVFASAAMLLLPASIFLVTLFVEKEGRFYNILLYLLLANMIISQALLF